VRTKLTPGRESLFLEVLRAGGSIEKACQTAGFSRASAFAWKSKHPKFAERWSAAIEAGTDLIEDEATRRAIEGVQRPIYQGGKLVGFELVFSDRLIELLLKARRPSKYREHASLEFHGSIDGQAEASSAYERLAKKLDAGAERLQARILELAADPARASAEQAPESLERMRLPGPRVSNP
jgi:hypothetical protein